MPAGREAGRGREVVIPASRRGAPRAYSPATASGDLVFPSGLDRVLRVTVYLTDIERQHGPMTAVFKEVFPVDPPARTTVQVAALSGPDKLIEIDAIAAHGSGATG